MPSFGAWELEALDQCYENVDYVSFTCLKLECPEVY